MADRWTSCNQLVTKHQSFSSVLLSKLIQVMARSDRNSD
uniref:Uncharacterized protein n=1 Tax=Arundo donax TaxID=35708 RepID=A0A0A9HA11_ARUDO